MKRLIAIALLAACGGTDGIPSDADVPSFEESIDKETEVNATQKTCANPTEWSSTATFNSCTSVCATKPPPNAMPVPAGYRCCLADNFDCDEARWFYVDGIPGVCTPEPTARQFVKWQICQHESWSGR